ncbi:MAG: hypothetical protein DDT23_00993 [candidate division WS2 bacterium]|nr:hypothetical protein [Candidatus Lithacetigena glycinireducens]
MKIIRDIFIIGWMSFYPLFKSSPLSQLVIVGFFGIVPIIFVLVLGGGGDKLYHTIAGASVSILGFAAINTMLQDIYNDRYIKLREMMVAMPINPMSYAYGVALSSLFFSLPGVLLFLSYLLFTGKISLFSLPAVLTAILLCWLSISAIGFTIATYMTRATPMTISATSNLLGIVFVFLPPVYYPKEILGSLSFLGLLIPTSNAASIIRGLAGLGPMDLQSSLLHWSMLILSCILFIFISYQKSKWRED